MKKIICLLAALALLLGICVRTLTAALQSRDALGRNICVGIFAALFLQTVINLGKDLAMQIAAMNPAYVSSDEVPEAEVEKEKAVQLAKAREENASNTKMPEEKKQMIAEKKVAGRMNNYFAEVCLLNQQFVKESKMTVEQHVKAVAKEVGGDIKVVKFARFETGEGLAKKEEDFAAEVASMIK